MNIGNIATIARYERRLLIRSWLFRLFMVLIFLGIIGLQAGMLTRIFSPYKTVWDYVALPAQIPYFSAGLYAFLQSIVLIFLTGDILAKGNKMDTLDVIFVHPMSNADYVWGKVAGISEVFLGMSVVPLLTGMGFHLLSSEAAFDIFYYLFYWATLIVPSFLFTLGFSLFFRCVINNKALALLFTLGCLGLIVFLLPEKGYGVFDIYARVIPAVASQKFGMAEPVIFLWQRGIYLIMGISLLLLCVAMIKRLPNTPHKRKIIGAESGLLLLVSLWMGGKYVTHFERIGQDRQQYRAVYREYQDKPKVDVLSNDIYFRQEGKEMIVKSCLRVKNNRLQPMGNILLFLNPGLKVLNVYRGKKSVDFKRDKQVLLINEALEQKEECNIEVEYRGIPDETICYADVPDFLYWKMSQELVPLSHFGKKYLYIENDYVLLTPECMWYPVAHPPVNPGAPYYLTKNFTNYSLKVVNPGDKTVISSGDCRMRGDTVCFENDHPLPCISLTIGDYEKKAVTVDSVSYEFYAFRGHDFSLHSFDTLKDTLAPVVRSIRARMEYGYNKKYPFAYFRLVETPVHFTTYARSWKLNNEYVMPGVLFLPERGLGTNIAFEAYIHMMQESGGAFQHDEISMKIGILTQYLHRLLVDDSRGVRGMFGGFGQQSNPWAAGAMMNAFSSYIQAEEFPLADLLWVKIAGSGYDFSFTWRQESELEAERQALLYLEGHSLEEALTDTQLPPDVFSIILKFKMDYFAKYLFLHIDKKELPKFFSAFYKTRRFNVIPWEELLREFKAYFHFDPEPFLHSWYRQRHLPFLKLKGFDANTVRMGELTQYQVTFEVYNSSEVEAIISPEILCSSGSSFYGESENIVVSVQTENRIGSFLIPAHSARRIKIITSEEPLQITVKMNLSRNVPNSIAYLLENTDRVIHDTLSGAFPMDIHTFLPDSNEIIIDNEDPGFRLVGSGQRHLLKKWLLPQAEEKYRQRAFFYEAYDWVYTLGGDCYGNEVSSVCMKKRGIGRCKAIWTATMPVAGRYEVWAWNVKGEVFMTLHEKDQDGGNEYTYKIKWPGGEEKVTLNMGMEGVGWVSLGHFDFPAGTVEVTLTDDVSGKVVRADAVKFVKEKCE